MPHSPNKKPTRAATLADVGREAGVSAMAASAVLNGAQTSSRIASETRQRILEAAARLRYRPNAAARALADRRMNTLGVAAAFTDTIELNNYFLEVFNGVISAAVQREQNTTVFALHDWEKDASRLSGFCDGRIDGLILIAPVLSKKASQLLPDHAAFVSLHANSPLPGVVNIESDEEAGAYQMVKYLIEQGHRRILHLSGDRGLLGAERRIRGYQRALEEASIPFDESLLAESTFDTRVGASAWYAWLARSVGQPMPQAIFCANDAIATGCLEALAQAGLRVPEDVSVAGFDDTLLARTSMPQLTTVRQPLRAMGARAVESLLARIGQVAEEIKDPIVFPTEVIIRASVCPPSGFSRTIVAGGPGPRPKARTAKPSV